MSQNEAISLVDMDGTLCDFDGAMLRDLKAMQSPSEDRLPSDIFNDDDEDRSWLKAPRKTVEAIHPEMNPRSAVRGHLRRLSAAGDLEDRCQRCGDCCCLSIKLPRPDGRAERILIPDLPCRFLVPGPHGTRVCEVYPDRFGKAPWCNNTEDSMWAGLYTSGCGYIEGAPWYRGSTRVPDSVMRLVLPEVSACLREPFRTEDIHRFCEKWGCHGDRP